MGTRHRKPKQAFTEDDVASLGHHIKHLNDFDTRAKRVDTAKALHMRLKEQLTYGEIGERLGVSAIAVRANLTKFLELIEDPGELKAYQEGKPDLLEAMELKLFNFMKDSLNGKNAGKTSLKDISLALKVVADLTRLYNNQSTANVSVLMNSIKEAHQSPVAVPEGKACPQNSNLNGTSTPTEPLPKLLPLVEHSSQTLTEPSNVSSTCSQP